MVYQSTGLILFRAMMMERSLSLKVMLRPQKEAVEKAREQMMAALEKIGSLTLS